MIASEKENFFLYRKTMCPRVVARSRYREQIVMKLNCFLPFDNPLGPNPQRAIVRMHYALAAQTSF